MRGFIKHLKMGNNFGFIRAKNNNEYFFHRDDYDGDWGALQIEFEKTRNVMVIFEPDSEAPKGPRASNVRLSVGE